MPSPRCVKRSLCLRYFVIVVFDVCARTKSAFRFLVRTTTSSLFYYLHFIQLFYRRRYFCIYIYGTYKYTIIFLIRFENSFFVVIINTASSVATITYFGAIEGMRARSTTTVVGIHYVVRTYATTTFVPTRVPAVYLRRFHTVSPWPVSEDSTAGLRHSHGQEAVYNVVYVYIIIIMIIII